MNLVPDIGAGNSHAAPDLTGRQVDRRNTLLTAQSGIDAIAHEHEIAGPVDDGRGFDPDHRMPIDVGHERFIRQAARKVRRTRRVRRSQVDHRSQLLERRIRIERVELVGDGSDPDHRATRAAKLDRLEKQRLSQHRRVDGQGVQQLEGLDRRLIQSRPRRGAGSHVVVALRQHIQPR